MHSSWLSRILYPFRISDVLYGINHTCGLWLEMERASLLVNKSIKSAAAILYLICLFLVTPAVAQDAHLTEIQVSRDNNHLLINFRVADCFTEDMARAIENGINTTFTFCIRLYETRDFWWDRKIADLKVSRDIQYDNLKKIYTVTQSDRMGDAQSTQDLEEAKDLLSRIDGMELAELDTLIKDCRYRICMMAELDKIRLPFYLHYVFFFLSLWDFETDWYTMEFTY